MKRMKLFAVCLTVACSLMAPGIAMAVQYQIDVLDTPQGQTLSGAYEVNDYGVVAGVAWTQFGSTSVYYWDAGGTPHNAGFPPGGAPATLGLNNSGTIVCNGYVSTNGTLTTLPELISNGGYNQFYDINDAGVVAGESVSDPSTTHATIWDSAGIHDLTASSGALPISAASEALLINDSSQVVGFYAGGINPEAFLWQNGKMTAIGDVNPVDMNNLGVVVGNVYDSTNGPYSTAYIYQNGQLTNLLGLTNESTSATGINDHGQIAISSVTWYGSTSYGPPKAYVWDDSTLTPLPDLGYGATTGGINDNGWVVGMAYDSAGTKYAVEWIPVPESSSILALLGGLAGLAGFALRRRKA